MARKKRTYNTNLIKKRRSYTLKEIAELYGVHIRTVQQWKKDGLQVIEGSCRPYLVHGMELKRFLKERAKKRKHPLKIDEFFCVRCQCARKSLPLLVTVQITDSKLGKSCKQAIIRGKCEVCNCDLVRFTSDRKVLEMKRNGIL